MGMERNDLGRFKGLFQYFPGTIEKPPQIPTGITDIYSVYL
jgi:hypothetical protein